jgi:hypothetical protein
MLAQITIIDTIGATEKDIIDFVVVVGHSFVVMQVKFENHMK